jgi:hypothetical protein
VPSTIPAKRPAETPTEQRSPGPKFSRPSSQTASPALAAAKKAVPQSSPLVPPATVPAPPSLSSASPAVPPTAAVSFSPPKPPTREPVDSGVIDLTQRTPEIAPAVTQNRNQPSKVNPPQAPPLMPNPAQPSQATQPPAQNQSFATSQPPPMQPQPQPQAHTPQFALNLDQFASASLADIQAKLKQVEKRLMELNAMHMEATQAGRTEDGNKYALLTRQRAAMSHGWRLLKALEKKKLDQAQGSSQPMQEPAPNTSTSQHQTPTMSSTPQPAAPNASSQSTPRLATSHIPANQNLNPMSAINPPPSNINPTWPANVGPGSAANPALLQTFNPTTTQIPAQVGLGGVSAPDAHPLGAMPQPGHSQSNSLGQHSQMPAGVAAQMKKLVEQRGFVQNTQAFGTGGNGAGTNVGAAGSGSSPSSGPGPAMTGGFVEPRDNQWLGTLMWQGTDTTRNEKKEVRAQVMATAPSGNACVHFLMHTSINEKASTFVTDGHRRGQSFCHLLLLDPRWQWKSSKSGSRRPNRLSCGSCPHLGRTSTTMDSWSNCSGIKATYVVGVFLSETVL